MHARRCQRLRRDGKGLGKSEGRASAATRMDTVLLHARHVYAGVRNPLAHAFTVINLGTVCLSARRAIVRVALDSGV